MARSPSPAYQVELRPAARRQLRKLSGDARRRVAALVDQLAIEPRPAGVKALAGRPDLLRVRSGDYRVVYAVRDEQVLVLVVALGHRSEVYRGV
jgi:mRNA interferase RelE/StbE